MTTKQLIEQLITEGGAIVSSSACSVIEIADAQATGRFAVNEEGMGFVRRYSEWLAVSKEAQNKYRTAWHALNAIAHDGNPYAKRIIDGLPRP